MLAVERVSYSVQLFQHGIEAIMPLTLTILKQRALYNMRLVAAQVFEGRAALASRQRC